MLGEIIDVPSSALDPLRAVAVIEDYKPLDVECAAVNLALLAGIRERYPEWRLLVDGDGGDENLKDYPIEENSELTIRSVVNNRMLYQEGWGVESIKHSLTYSGGYSRGCVRSYACAREYGFDGFSPYTRPSVIAVAEAIPFAELTQGSHERLYALKGEIVCARHSRGARARHAGVSEAPIPARLGVGDAGRAAVSRRTRRATAAISRRCTPRRVIASAADRRIRSFSGRRSRACRSVTAHGSLDRGGAPAGRQDRARADGFSRRRRVSVHVLVLRLWQLHDRRADAAGALPTQIEDAFSPRSTSPLPDRLKLYNASNFFDRRAVPPTTCRESPSCARRSRRHGRVAREHDRRGDARLRAAARRPASRSPMGSRRFIPSRRRSSTSGSISRDSIAPPTFSPTNGIDLRVFVLLGAPHVPPDESVEWTVRTVEYAARCGAAVVSIIPVRGGNGEMERLPDARSLHAADAVAAGSSARSLSRVREHRRHRGPLGRGAAARVRALPRRARRATASHQCDRRARSRGRVHRVRIGSDDEAMRGRDRRQRIRRLAAGARARGARLRRRAARARHASAIRDRRVVDAARQSVARANRRDAMVWRTAITSPRMADGSSISRIFAVG